MRKRSWVAPVTVAPCVTCCPSEYCECTSEVHCKVQSAPVRLDANDDDTRNVSTAEDVSGAKPPGEPASAVGAGEIETYPGKLIEVDAIAGYALGHAMVAPS